MNKPKLWTKDFLVVTFVNLFLSLNFFLLMVMIPTYAIDSFNSSPGAAGLASSIFVIGGVLSRLLSGKWIEWIGRKKTLYAGLILSLVMMVLYFAAHDYLLLLIVRFFHGAGFGIASTATGTIIANIIPRERRGEGMAYYISLSATTSLAIGPFVGLFILQHGSYNGVFLTCIIFAVLSLLGLFILSVPEIKLTEQQLKESKEFKLNRFFETKAVPISIVIGVIYICYSCVLTFISTYSKEIDLVAAAGFFFIVFSVVVLISRPFVGRLFDAKGENIVIYPAIVSFALGMAFLSQTNSGFVLLLAGGLIGLGIGSLQSSCQTIVIKVVPSHLIGLGTSTYLIFVDVAVGIGPIIFGLFVPLAGYRGMYLISAFIALSCVLIYYLVYGKIAAKRLEKTGQ
jgi:MFS family permease